MSNAYVTDPISGRRMKVGTAYHKRVTDEYAALEKPRSHAQISPQQFRRPAVEAGEGRKPVTTYHIHQNMSVHFGVANDVEHNTHFDILGNPMPTGTQIYVLAPQQQNFVRSLGMIIKGVAYRTLEDLEADIRDKAQNLDAFLRDHIDQSGASRKERDAMNSYLDLVEGKVVKLVRDNWVLYQIKLP